MLKRRGEQSENSRGSEVCTKLHEAGKNFGSFSFHSQKFFSGLSKWNGEDCKLSISKRNGYEINGKRMHPHFRFAAKQKRCLIGHDRDSSRIEAT